jgi:hypothetical protein
MSNIRNHRRFISYRMVSVSLGILIYSLIPEYTWAGGVNLCPADRPCFNGSYQDCHRVVFQFTGVTGWDFYNVRYRTAGGGETQVENKSGMYTIENAKPNSTYTIKVQGCNSNILASSDCSPWVESSVTTVGDYGQDTCQAGYVWREAFSGDHVCVDPKVRDQAANDNYQAAFRRQPGGGPYGPDTCQTGYVWREAFSGDHVCVDPNIRTQTLDQNRRASKTRLCS